MAVIGIAGLPGSGKSALMRELQKQGYSRYDDINKNWADNLRRARDEARLGKNLAISDIMFCHQSFREKLDKELGLPAQWIFFENDAWQCAKNCLWRFMFEKPDRPLVRGRPLPAVDCPAGKTGPIAHPLTPLLTFSPSAPPPMLPRCLA